MNPQRSLRRPVIVLGTDGPFTRIIYHALVANFGDVRIVLEEPVSRMLLLRRRVLKLGLLHTAGQVLFMAGILPLIRRRAARRIKQILRDHSLDDSPVTGEVLRVASVNSSEARLLLQELAPAAVVVNGTRIIGRETLRSVTSPFINIHAGITPLYRGVHGGYWALFEGRPDMVGTTIHLVDEGIDTGTVLDQVTFAPAPEDSFATYPYLHTAAALPPLLQAVRSAVDGALKPRLHRAGLDSRLRYHPTAVEYLHARFRRGVR